MATVIDDTIDLELAPTRQPTAMLGEASVHHVLDRTKNGNPITLQWKDINYSVDTYDKPTKTSNIKTILHSISGYAAAGSMVAIMGPTGSGKTSLLNVLGKFVHPLSRQSTVPLIRCPAQ